MKLKDEIYVEIGQFLLAKCVFWLIFPLYYRPLIIIFMLKALLFSGLLLVLASSAGEKGATAVTVDYPVRFTYIDKVSTWGTIAQIAAGMSVPNYANPPNLYNYVCLTFWTCAAGPVDMAIVWSNPMNFIGAGEFGSSNQEIQTNMKGNYSSGGVKLMISAFGATEYPTTSGYDATTCATKLAQFVIDNQFDGVDIDYEDTPAFAAGTGEQWLITLTTVLRQKLPANAIITHAPQAPYFGGKSLYPNNAYLAIDQAVGSMIQFYNIQFYNQGVGIYDTAEGLFNISGGWAPGTSVNEIIAAGVPADKIVVGKPVTTSDANNAWMSAASLSDALVANYHYNGWRAGVMFWQFSSDVKGSFCSGAISALLSLFGHPIEATQ
jgi:hypothetical protein